MEFKDHRVLEFNQSEWLKTICQIITQKWKEAEKNGSKDEKAL